MTTSAEQLAQLQAKIAEERNAYKALVVDTVPPAVQKLISISEQLQKAKAETFEMFRNIIEMKNDLYGVVSGQQSHTFTAGEYSITIGYNVLDGWDDTVSAGIERVQQFIQKLGTSDESDPKKKQKDEFLINQLMKYLKMDRQGNLNANRVLEMEKNAVESGYSELIDSIKIIREAYRPTRSTWYIEATKTDPAGKKVNIPLSMSTVPFPEGFEFDFVIQNK